MNRLPLVLVLLLCRPARAALIAVTSASDVLTFTAAPSSGPLISGQDHCPMAATRAPAMATNLVGTPTSVSFEALCGVKIAIHAVPVKQRSVVQIKAYLNDILVYEKSRGPTTATGGVPLDGTFLGLDGGRYRGKAVTFKAEMTVYDPTIYDPHKNRESKVAAAPIIVNFSFPPPSFSPKQMGENGHRDSRPRPYGMVGPILSSPRPGSMSVSFYLDQNRSDIDVCVRNSSPRDTDSPNLSEMGCDPASGWRKLPNSLSADWATVLRGPSAEFVIKKNGSVTEADSVPAKTVTHYLAQFSVQPDQLMEYKIVDRSTPPLLLSKRVIFRTAPSKLEADRTFYFGAGSDFVNHYGRCSIGDGYIDGGCHVFNSCSSCGDDRAMFRQIVDQISSRPALGQLDLFIMPGDVSNSEGTSGQYYNFLLRPFEPMASYTPLFPIHGNHDLFHDSGFSFFDMLDLPRSPAENILHRLHPDSDLNIKGYSSFYTFDWGPVRFIALDESDKHQEDDATAMDGFETGDAINEQADFLKAAVDDAEHDPKIAWIVAYFHNPPHTMPQSSRVATILREHAHLIISGHHEWPFVDDGDMFSSAAGRRVPFVVTPSGGSRSSFATAAGCNVGGRNKFGFDVFKVTFDEIYMTGFTQDGKSIIEMKLTRNPLSHAPIAKVLKYPVDNCCDKGVFTPETASHAVANFCPK